MITPETILSIFVGIGLAAAVGFRIFVPLFVLSLASHFGAIPLNDKFEWLASSAALISLGVATIVEIGAYLIPWLDHLLDTLAVPLAAIAGTAVMASTLTDMNPALTWALAIIAGGGTATAVQTSTVAARGTSTLTTAGLANPVFSVIESATSLLMSVLSIFVPVLAIILLGILLIGSYKLIKKIRKKKIPH